MPDTIDLTKLYEQYDSGHVSLKEISGKIAQVLLGTDAKFLRDEFEWASRNGISTKEFDYLMVRLYDWCESHSLKLLTNP